MNSRLTDGELAKIIQRDAMAGATWFTGPPSFTALAAQDRRALIEDLCALLAERALGATKERVDNLESLLISARWYVSEFQPQRFEDQYQKYMLLQEIDNAIPQAPPAELCGEQYCCRPKGHEGAHDDLPF